MGIRPCPCACTDPWRCAWCRHPGPRQVPAIGEGWVPAGWLLRLGRAAFGFGAGFSRASTDRVAASTRWPVRAASHADGWPDETSPRSPRSEAAAPLQAPGIVQALARASDCYEQRRTASSVALKWAEEPRPAREPRRRAASTDLAWRKIVSRRNTAPLLRSCGADHMILTRVGRHSHRLYEQTSFLTYHWRRRRGQTPLQLGTAVVRGNARVSAIAPIGHDAAVAMKP